MKFILKHGKSQKDIVSLRQEIEILRGLRHENIIQMLDSFETDEEFCVVTEFAQGRSCTGTPLHQSLPCRCNIPLTQPCSTHLAKDKTAARPRDCLQMHGMPAMVPLVTIYWSAYLSRRGAF